MIVRVALFRSSSIGETAGAAARVTFGGLPGHATADRDRIANAGIHELPIARIIEFWVLLWHATEHARAQGAGGHTRKVVSRTANRRDILLRIAVGLHPLEYTRLHGLRVLVVVVEIKRARAFRMELLLGPRGPIVPDRFDTGVTLISGINTTDVLAGLLGTLLGVLEDIFDGHVIQR
jgi:hypothetical protein